MILLGTAYGGVLRYVIQSPGLSQGAAIHATIFPSFSSVGFPALQKSRSGLSRPERLFRQSKEGKVLLG